MAQMGRPGLQQSEKELVWKLWKAGRSFSEIDRGIIDAISIH